MSSLSRRRFIALSAMMIGSSLLPSSAKAASHKIQWKGTALGADAELSLFHEDQELANRIIETCVSEINRLESIFSLFQRNSAITQLNKNGVLDNPPTEFVELLKFSSHISEKTEGAFDITVQPLWVLYAQHFAKETSNSSGPSQADINHALKSIGWKNITISPAKIQFNKPDMAITLNGIAQGYITDHIITLLKDHGFKNVVADLGEIRTLGTHPIKGQWKIRVPDGEAVSVNNMALSTSSRNLSAFNTAKNHHHIFNPIIGKSPQGHEHITVLAPTATLADALSTSFFVMTEEKIQHSLQSFKNIKIIV